MLQLLCFKEEGFSTILDKGLKRTKKREIGKHKINEMEALNMKQKKANKLRLPCSLIAFKYGCSLEITSTALEEKTPPPPPGHLLFFRKFQDNSNVHLENRKLTCIQYY